jgi:large subunit ribosomal protein L23
MTNTNPRLLIDLIKYPIITDKATRLLEANQYSFATDPKADKYEIKAAIEYLFEVKVTSVNTYNTPRKTRRIGRFLGHKPKYKRAIVTLASGNSINLFSEN